MTTPPRFQEPGIPVRVAFLHCTRSLWSVSVSAYIRRQAGMIWPVRPHAAPPDGYACVGLLWLAKSDVWPWCHVITVVVQRYKKTEKTWTSPELGLRAWLEVD